MSSFLDSTGLSRLVSKITDYFAKKDGTYPNMTVGRVDPRMYNPTYIQLDFSNTSWADFSGSGASSLLQKVFGSNYAINSTITFIGRNTGLPNDWETNTGISAGPMKWGIVLGFKCVDMWVVDFYINNTYSGASPSRVVRFGLGSGGIKTIEKFVVSHGASDVGSAFTPVYVDSTGSVAACTLSLNSTYVRINSSSYNLYTTLKPSFLCCAILHNATNAASTISTGSGSYTLQAQSVAVFVWDGTYWYKMPYSN